MSYKVQWESGSLVRGTHKFHRKSYPSKRRAETVAARASRMTGGYVVVMQGYREVAECYKGVCKNPQRRR